MRITGNYYVSEEEYNGYKIEYVTNVNDGYVTAECLRNGARADGFTKEEARDRLFNSIGKVERIRKLEFEECINEMFKRRKIFAGYAEKLDKQDLSDYLNLSSTIDYDCIRNKVNRFISRYQSAPNPEELYDFEKLGVIRKFDWVDEDYEGPGPRYEMKMSFSEYIDNLLLCEEEDLYYGIKTIKKNIDVKRLDTLADCYCDFYKLGRPRELLKIPIFVRVIREFKNHPEIINFIREEFCNYWNEKSYI
jgi:hypothetical protein